MKLKKILTLLVLVLIILTLQFCGKSSTEPDVNTEEQVTISGRVIDFDDGEPVNNAAIKMIVDSIQYGTTTNSEGRYSKTFNLRKSVDVKVIASKESYRGDTVKVFAIPGRTVDAPTLKVKKDSVLVTTTFPASITLVGQTNYQIGVRESGDNETTTLTFEVRDSTGRPLDISSSVTVRFLLGASPGGGEFIYPTSRKTNSLGQASVGVTSGTKAGVVQVIAEVNKDGRIIRSNPVAVAIHGGLPDINHFSVTPQFVNVPGLVLYGYNNKITAYIGDKYSNPVKPNTVVYFNTTGGIIQGSAVSSGNNPAVSVNLTTAAPNPTHPVLGPGFATITASTASENNQIISKNVVVLFSGYPVNFSVSPTTFDIPNGGYQNFTYIVADQNNNPISSANTIKVTVEGNVKAKGDLNVQMPDTQSRAWTIFNFMIEDADPTKVEPNQVYITIQVDGINGKNSLSIQGTAR
ncbi:MAG: hypothetical protein N2043_06560 [Ignavibacterium sp.]|nr:hypothetical protein [Ignavibacterium sp.]